MFAFITNPRRPDHFCAIKLCCERTFRWSFILVFLFTAVPATTGDDPSSKPEVSVAGFAYTNYRVAEIPWSIHVVRVERLNPQFEFQSMHARGGALGLSTLSDQIKLVDSRLGAPIAAVNGDYYQRDEAYAGDPRGLQIVDGEVLSAPTGGTCFWIDALGQPHVTNVASLFQITWPNGAASSFGLNED